ncbi:MAG TPA: hypothetical protein VE961_00860 [Pyrinomonadaceae bacterium]|nr:hypothetical protein [Pyrinomonadaceae bacterium]
MIGRISATVLAAVCLLLGFLMGHRSEEQFGNTLFISGAIIISGILLSAAISERRQQP